ncbi:MAG: phosphotransferase [Pseudomonadota bacterium]
MGHGSEATVYELTNGKILRLEHSPTGLDNLQTRVSLLSQLKSDPAKTGLKVPKVREYGTLHGRNYTIEDRLEGEVLAKVLERLSGSRREELIEDYMAATTKLGGLWTGDGKTFGDIAGGQLIQRPTFREYLRDRAAKCLSVSRLNVDLEELIKPITEPSQPELVHLDYYPSNVLCSDSKISAVLDFGSTSIAGWGLFNLATGLAFLDPETTPNVNLGDQKQAQEWLKRTRPHLPFNAIQRWLAVYWSICDVKDAPFRYPWCRKVLDI